MYGHIDFVINIENIRITVIIVYPFGKSLCFSEKISIKFYGGLIIMQSSE